MASSGYCSSLKKHHPKQDPSHSRPKTSILKFLHKVVLGKKTEADQIEENFLSIDSQTALTFFEKKLEILEDEKEAISKNFYNDYVEYVFGYDKDGKEYRNIPTERSLAPPE